MTRRQYDPVCSVADCDRAHYSHGLCSMHDQRMRRRGTTDLQVHVTETTVRTVKSQQYRHRLVPRLRMQGIDVLEVAACEGYYRAADVARHYGLRDDQVREVWREVDPGETAIPNIEAKPQPRMLVRDVEILALHRGMTYREISKELGVSANFVGRVLAELGYSQDQVQATPHAPHLNRVNQVGHL